MTGSQVNDFIGQIAEAYAALQAKPELEREIARLRDQHRADGDTIADLEFRIHAKNEELEAASNTRRSLEVERDQAQFQVLELEERLHNIANYISDARGILADVMDVPLTKAKAQTVVEKPTPPEPVHVEQSYPYSFVGQSDTPLSATTHSDTTPSPVESPAHPTESAAGSPDESAPKLRPYEGKFYHDMIDYIPRYQWIEGGGTDYSYDWRPSHGSTGF